MKTILTLSALSSCLLLTSCPSPIQGEFRGPITGAIYNEDGVSVDEKTIGSLFDKLGRLAAGESFEDVILDPFTK